MEIRINGSKQEGPVGTEPHQRLLAALQELNGRGEVVRNVLVDGVAHDLDVEMLCTVLSEQTVTTVELATIPRHQLLRETVSQMVQALPQIGESMNHVARQFRQGQDEAAFDTLPSAMEGLHSYLKVLSLLSEKETLQRAAQSRFQALNLVLQEASEALQVKDYVLFADLLHYEIAERLKRGEQWLSQLPAR